MFKAALLDLGGVVYVGESPLPGALEAIGRLRAAGLAVRFITNTTRTPRRRLLARLGAMGLMLSEGDLFTPAVAARAYLAERGLAAHLLIHPALAEDFAGLAEGGESAVVIGDAADGFSYDALNAAFRRLMDGAPFVALAPNRFFADADGQPSLDAGPFVAALEYATGRSATVFGKPSADFFGHAVASVGCAPQDAVMVGDDAEADVAGARRAGLAGVLVRTGKYRAGAEDAFDPAPSATVADLAAAVDWIVSASA